MTVKQLCLKDQCKLAFDLQVKFFYSISSLGEYAFISSLSAQERAYIHRICSHLGIMSKSEGSGDDRKIILYKENIRQPLIKVPELNLSTATIQIIEKYVNQMLLVNFNYFRNQFQTLQMQKSDFDVTKYSRNGKIGQIMPLIPSSNSQKDETILNFRKNLPVYAYRKEIINKIENNQMVILTGETGSGKTTQVPQFILDHYNEINKPCSIVVAQPRRIAAVSVANRISFERGESIGQSVGYQIRLESRLSPKTLITFCTNGVLIRTLISSKPIFSKITHIIIDEVHERDYQTDILMTYFKIMKEQFPNIKFIFMSASLDIVKLSNYLNNCPVISVPGRTFNVQQYFLEDILDLINYESKQMKSFKEMLISSEERRRQVNQWSADLKAKRDALAAKNNDHCNDSTNSSTNSVKFYIDDDLLAELIEESDDGKPQLKTTPEDLLKDAIKYGGDDEFRKLIYLIYNRIVPVDFQDKETGLTSLQAAICHDKFYLAINFLYLGADILLKSANGNNAIDWARSFKLENIVFTLESYLEFEKNAIEMAKYNEEQHKSYFCNPHKPIDVYKVSTDHSICGEVDINLIYEIIFYILKTWPVHEHKASTILVFLPGYKEIMRLNDLIQFKVKNTRNVENFSVYTIHSQINTSDQKKIFEPEENGARKIILSTNISETSITIDDIGFIIDSGKVKETYYDSKNDFTQLDLFWTSKSSVQQRKGRAGRCNNGICFHLYTREIYNSMETYQSPIIQRMPMQQICLQSKLLLENHEITVEEFLKTVLDPPNESNVHASIEKLKKIEALDSNGNLSELGVHLLDLPLDPSYGKMILYSVILRCLDPVLTIVCTLANKDPFSICDRAKRVNQLKAKIKYGKSTFSDHMVLLRVFQEWQKAQSQNDEENFINENGIDPSIMDMIVAMRSKILGQLRASGFVRTRQPNDIQELNQNSNSWAVVKGALCAGQFPNIINKDKDYCGETSKQTYQIKFHPSSIFNTISLNNLPAKWLIYNQNIKKSNKTFLQYCTVVSPLTVALFSSPTKHSTDGLSEELIDDLINLTAESDSENEEQTTKLVELKLDDHIKFKMPADHANKIIKLRQQLHFIFQRRMLAPNKLPTADEEVLINTVVEMLKFEENKFSEYFKNPENIGQRPKQMNQVFEPVLFKHINSDIIDDLLDI